MSSGSWSEVFAPERRAPLATISLGVGLYALNAFLVATALPNAVMDIGGVHLMSWSVAIFLVMAIVGGAAASLLKARIGSRLALILPAALFLIGTLVAGLAPSMPVLLAGRALQGLGEGVIAALSYALIPVFFPPRLVPKVFGVEAVVWAVAAAGGPLVAGLLTEFLSWRWAFLFSAPLALLFMALARRAVPGDDRDPAAGGRLPLLRLLGIGGGILLVAVAGLLEAWQAGLAVLAALLLLAGVVWLDRRCRTQIFPGDAFTLRSTVGAGLWMVLLMPLSQSGTMVYLAYLIQTLLAAGPTLAGVMNATLALSWSAVAILVADRAGPGRAKLLIRLGPALLLAGFGGLALGFALKAPALVILAQMLLGAGFGASWAFLSQSIMEAARPGERDRAAGLVPTVQSAGYGLGAAAAGLVANRTGLESNPAAFLPWLLATCAVFALLALAVSPRVRPPPAPP